MKRLDDNRNPGIHLITAMLLGVSSTALTAGAVDGANGRPDILQFSRLSCEQLLAPNPAQIAAAIKDMEDAGKQAKLARTSTGVSAANQLIADKTKAVAELTAKNAVAPEETIPADSDQTVGDRAADALEAVQSNASSLETLRYLWDDGAHYEPAHRIESLRLRERIVDCSERAYAVTSSQAEVVKKLDAESAQAAQAGAILLNAREDYVYVAQQQNYDRPQLSIFTGPTLSLNGDDKFKTGFEVAALFDGGAGSLFGYGRVFGDFIYQTRGSVDVAKETDGSVGQPNADQLFRNDKGLLRFNTGVSTGIDSDNRYSAFVSGGLSTIPGIGGDFPQALRPRYAVGMLGRAFVSEGLYTRLSLSVAHDEYWRQPSGADATQVINSFERGVVEALVLAPKLSASGVVLAGRITLDTPLDGKGPSEVRFSVLASLDFGSFLQKIIKLG